MSKLVVPFLSLAEMDLDRTMDWHPFERIKTTEKESNHRTKGQAVKKRKRSISKKSKRMNRRR